MKNRTNLIAILNLIILCFHGTVLAEEIQWMVNDNIGNPCLIAEMNIKANFSYNATDSKVKNILYEVPNNITQVNAGLSKCDKLIVEWSNGNNIEVLFAKNNKSYDLSSFKLTINITDVFKDSLENKTIEIMYMHPGNDTSFETPSNFSFHCNREQILNSTSINVDGSYIILSKVQYEAFKTDKTKKFSLAKDCESNFKPDIVPIAVGLSLIALIIVVLIAYIVGRRRQQARGYLNIM